ncbi:MAG: NAD(P)-binding domain-containing protein [Polyangiaceae bacterium]|nr:NAD(P)-binding domain-containing protein [Polyangiaceae bacterium]
MRRVAIIGGGAWGLALAAAAARAGSDVVVQSRRDLGESASRGIRVVRTVAEAARHARLIVIAAPSSVCRSVARVLGDYVDGSHYVMHGVRGLEGENLETISDIIRHETPVKRTGALGGPALAHDLMDGRPSVLVTGSRFPEVNEAVMAAFSSSMLRVYSTLDLRGLEWASALAGCLTLAVGYAQALQMSAGLIAAFITRSIDEASRIAAVACGKDTTLLGLAGYGDMLASIAQSERPEILVGAALGRGLSRDDAINAGGLHIEALDLIPRVADWAEVRGVRAPIFRALAQSVMKGEPTDMIVHELMTLPLSIRI